jgi:DNA-3-methyladenine glycosylase
VSELRRVLAGDVADAARSLLGCRLRSSVGGAICEVELREVEAYGGGDDPASHGYRGRSRRNASMFGPPGTLYVYRSYGIHWCLNVVAGAAGTAAAILLRAGRATMGEETMIARRGRRDHVADGPGKLAQALAVDAGYDGIDLLGEGSVRLLPRIGPPPPLEATPRIGITRETDRRWRFVVR